MPVVTKLVQGYSIRDMSEGSRRTLKKRGNRVMRNLGRSEIEMGLDEIIQDRVQDDLDVREAQRQAYWEEDRKDQEAYWARMDEKFEDDQYDPAYEDWKEKQAEMEWDYQQNQVIQKNCDDPYCTICEVRA